MRSVMKLISVGDFHCIRSCLFAYCSLSISYLVSISDLDAHEYGPYEISIVRDSNFQFIFSNDRFDFRQINNIKTLLAKLFINE